MMKRFCIHFTTFLVAVLVIWNFIFQHCQLRINPYDIARWKYKLEVVRNREVEFETIAVGDSAADAAIVPRIENKRIFNLGLGGGTPVDGFYYLTEYLKNHPAPKNLVISYSPLSLQSKSEFRTHTFAFSAFSLVDMLGIDAHSKEWENLCLETFELPAWLRTILPNSLVFDWEILSDFLSLNKSQLFFMKNLYKKNVYSINYNKYNELKILPNAHVETLVKINNIKNSAFQPRYKANDLFILYYQKIIELGLKIHSNVFILNPPNNAIYDGYYLDPSWANYKNFYNSLKTRHPKIDVYPSLIAYDISFFDDSFHVTEKGAKRFSDEMFRFILKK